jgi:multidrug efflux system membrane fusion protein
VLLTGGCAEKAKLEPALQVVTTQKVEMLEPTANEERYSAVIAPASQMEVLFKGAGYVEKIQTARDKTGSIRIIQEGDFVKRGSVLARLHQDDNKEKINEQQASLREVQLSDAKINALIETASAELKQAEIESERAQRLFALDSMTKPELDAANTKLSVAQSRLREIKAQIPVNRATQDRIRSAIAEARYSLKDTTLTAPMDGIILKRNIEEGSLANNGTSAFTMADTSSVKAIFGLPDIKLSQLSIGMPLDISTEAIPGKIFKGRVTDIGASADPKTRVFNIEVTIPNKAYELRSGMVASLIFGDKETKSPQMTIPFSAVIRSSKDPQGYSVYTLRIEGGKQVAEEKDVKLGQPSGRMITVLEGLHPNDEVITNGASRIANGQEVRAVR